MEAGLSISVQHAGPQPSWMQDGNPFLNLIHFLTPTPHRTGSSKHAQKYMLMQALPHVPRGPRRSDVQDARICGGAAGAAAAARDGHDLSRACS